jgi:hypothetical protein
MAQIDPNDPLVTAVGDQIESGFSLPVQDRAALELALGELARRHHQGRPEDPVALPDGSPAKLDSLPEPERLGKLWDRLSSMRNDLAHAGMSPNAMRAERLQLKAERDMWPIFDLLADEWLES